MGIMTWLFMFGAACCGGLIAGICIVSADLIVKYLNKRREEKRIEEFSKFIADEIAEEPIVI